MDVLSAALSYLAVHIRRESARLGIIGALSSNCADVVENIGSTLVKGDDECQSVDTDLRDAVDEFTSTLSHFGHSVGFKIFEAVEGITVIQPDLTTFRCTSRP